MRVSATLSGLIVIFLAWFLAGKKQHRDPVILCLARKGDYCILRTIRGYRELGEDGIDSVVIQCEQDCKALGMKCEALLHSADLVQYSCKRMECEMLGRGL